MNETAPLPQQRIIPVILCGGSGTRLWPASRENHPKQFLSLLGQSSLLQETLRRAGRVTGAGLSDMIVVTLASMHEKVARAVREIDGGRQAHILSEPSARNTAAAVALAAEYAARLFGKDCILWIMPSDHHIDNESALAFSFAHALAAARDGRLVTFGIAPTRAETGYGYIKHNRDGGECHTVAEFVEKPDLETARGYIRSGDYLWNSGMFVFRAADILCEYETFCPYITDGVRQAIKAGRPEAPDAASYARIATESFDKAIMEKTDNVCVVPTRAGWSDIGSWESLWELHAKDGNANAAEGEAVFANAERCFVKSRDKLVAVAGLDDIVVVEESDTILVAAKKDGASLRELVSAMKKQARPEVFDIAPEPDGQPWRMVKSARAESALKAREISIAPGERIIARGADGLCLYTVLEGTPSFSVNGTLRKLYALQSINIDTAEPYAIFNHGANTVQMIVVSKDEEEGLFFLPAASRSAA